MRSTKRRHVSEQLENRICLTSIGFIPNEIESSGLVITQDIQAIDVDGDLDNDLVVVSGNQLMWFENLDGKSEFSTERIISRSLDLPFRIAAGDLDQDGDLDIVVGSYINGVISWFENINADRRFDEERAVANLPGKLSDLVLEDMDADGDLDVAFGYENSVGWIENNKEAADRVDFASPRVIHEDEDFIWSLAAGDMDGDGSKDIVSVSNSQMILHTNSNGEFQQERIAGLNGWVEIADLNSDGSLDILVSTIETDAVLLFTNQGNGMFSEADNLLQFSRSARQVRVSDIDADQDLDIIAGAWDFSADSKLNLLKNDGAGNFTRDPAFVTRHEPNVFTLADMNGDDLPEIVLDDFNDLAWHMNRNGQFEAKQTFIVNADEVGFSRNQNADLDNDGDIDIVAFSPHLESYAWLENRDNANQFIRHDLEYGERPEPPFLIDVDRDGDTDLVSQAFDRFTWQENQGGGAFAPSENLSQFDDGFFGTNTMIAHDLTLDGFAEILFVDDGKLKYYLNKAEGLSFDAITIDSGLGRVRRLLVGDLNVDGDNDIVVVEAGQRFDSPSKWLRYDQQDNGEFVRTLIREDTSALLGLSDFDFDGDLDLLASESIDETTQFSVSLNLGTGDFAEAREITTVPGRSFFFDVADFDRDGDSDLLLYSLLQQSLAWIENDQGSFHQFTQITPQSESIFEPDLADYDSDGDVDFLAFSLTSDELLWYENRPIADVNDDGVFNSRDLVTVFQAAEYEDEFENNSTFLEGDWNGDQDFTSADLVLAFQLATFSNEAKGQLGFASEDVLAIVEDSDMDDSRLKWNDFEERTIGRDGVGTIHDFSFNMRFK